MTRFHQIVLCLGLILISMSSSAQAYQPLIGASGNYWYISLCVSQTCQWEYYFAVEDTMMDGKTYRFLDGFHYNKTLQIREDTAARQIFFRSNTVNKDLMIYDFSATVGSTMELFNPNSPMPHSSGYYTLDSIVPRMIKGGVHRFFYWSENAGPGTTTWIEGMGSMALINTPASERDLYGIGEVSCYYRDGVYVYESDTLPLGACDTTRMQTGLNHLSIEQDGISIYPNPSNGIIQVYDRNSRNGATLFLYDLSGKLVFTDYIQNDQAINLSHLKKGLYLLRWTNEKGAYLRKFVLN